MKNIVLLLFALLFGADALNILGIFPYEGKSHFFVFKIYLKELVKRGHHVTVISHFPENEPLMNYTDLSLAGSSKIIEDDLPAERSYLTIINTGIFLTTNGKESCEVMLSNKHVQNLLKTKPKFDVIVMEVFNSDCGFAIAYKLGAPVVGISSHVLMPWHYNRLGIPYNPSYVSFHFLGGGTKPTLYQRIERTIFDNFFKLLYYFVSQRGNQNTIKQYFDDVPPLEELAREMKFHLSYQHFVLTGSKLLPPNMIDIGGFHVADAKPLTGDLKRFVDEAKHGVILISFGSVVKSSTLPKNKLQAVLDTIKHLPQRFIWKWESETVLLEKDKLYLSNWLPQVDILGHPKTLAFFSHAGMGGTTEAIHYGVPVVAMPVVGDQPSNAAAIEESGLGVQIQIQDLTKESLLAAFKIVLEDSFRENVKQVSKAWHDRPMSPMDTAIFWTEYAARHPNKTFRAAAADVPLYQYLLLDVICVFILCISVLFVPVLSLSFYCRSKKKTGINRKKSKKE